jgi:hypothetical protein
MRPLHQHARESPGAGPKLHDDARAGEVDRIGDLTGQGGAAGKRSAHAKRVGKKRTQKANIQRRPSPRDAIRPAQYARHAMGTSAGSTAFD